MSEATARLSRVLAGRYAIERELGSGGMATVYFARDLKHDREVAIKLLRPELAAALGAERFLNEIRITARLDHPHVLMLIDSGADEGLFYYVLPFVRGESLRDKLKREKQLDIAEALAITTQVASALDHAHRHGVVHRDIKPENILLQEGEAMLTDFGLAFAEREAGEQRLTEVGLSVGTPQYMSPEQAMGSSEIGARSDVFSLASVLYEMLAGEPPVTGSSVQVMIARLLNERPTPVRTLRDAVPEGVSQALAKALAKTPADRFHGAGEFAAALARPGRLERRSEGWHRRDVAFGAAGALAVAALAFGTYRMVGGRSEPFVLGRSEQLTADSGLEIQPALSPSGELVAYAAGNAARMRIFVRPVGGGRAVALSDDAAAVEAQPRWSPDGENILFLTGGGVSVAPALGGASRPVVAPSTARVVSATWSPDGREIAFVRSDALLVTPAEGGDERIVAREGDLHSCAWSPDGSWIACARFNSESVVPGVSFANLAPSARRMVRDSSSSRTATARGTCTPSRSARRAGRAASRSV